MTEQKNQMTQSPKALRYNEGKLDWTLLDFKSLEPLVLTMEQGATKYARENWKLPCDDPRQHLQSAMRHLLAIISGDEYDKESGIRHVGHLLANAMMYSFHTKHLPNTSLQVSEPKKSPECDRLGHTMDAHECVCTKCGEYVIYS